MKADIQVYAKQIVDAEIGKLDLTPSGIGAATLKDVRQAIDNLNLTPQGIGAATPEDVRQAIANLTVADIDGAVTQAEFESVRQAIANLTVADIEGAATQADLQALQRSFAALPAFKTVTFDHAGWSDLIQLQAPGYGKATWILSSITWGPGTMTAAFVHFVRHAQDNSFIPPAQMSRLSHPDGSGYGVRFRGHGGHLQIQSFTAAGGANGKAYVF